jgi:thiosulfate dehydrogenase [quinone] large subunit
MPDTQVQRPVETGWHGRFLERDLPRAYLLLRVTTGVHMIAHGGVRLLSLGQFAAETREQFAGVTLIGLPLFPDWLVTPICYAIPPTQFLIGLLLTVGFKTRLASTLGSLVYVLVMFGQVSRMNFATAHLVWFYVMVFVILHALNFADRYSVDRMRSE